VDNAAGARSVSLDHGRRYLLRDRDAIYGRDLVAMTKALGMEDVITAPLSPWQNPYVERLIGSVRRECLDHAIVWNEDRCAELGEVILLTTSVPETHSALAKDAPELRTLEKQECGRMVAIPQLAGLRHRYQRHAA
jgi:putative transposase